MLTIIRHTYPEKTTVGTLYLPDRPLCATLEDQVRPAGQFVAGETAIPAGEHKIELGISPKFKRVLPLIYSASIPASRGIRVHRGEHIGHSLGCVLVGMAVAMSKRVAGVWTLSPHLLDSEAAELAVVDYLESIGGSTTLKIIEVRP